MDTSEKNDSKFVKAALEMQYKDDLEKLGERSVKGIRDTVRVYNGVTISYPSKLPLSPEKINAVRARFNERITANCADSLSFSSRISDTYFKKLLNVILSNHGRKRKTENNANVLQVNK